MVYGLRIPGNPQASKRTASPAPADATPRKSNPTISDALESTLKWNRIRGGTAAVILEPIGPESGTRPVAIRTTTSKVRELCNRYDALLIFDEVVSAFRIGLSGAQGYFDVTPDHDRLRQRSSPAATRRPADSADVATSWNTSPPDSKADKKRAMVGGTMAANPLSSAAGYYTICRNREERRLRQGRPGGRPTHRRPGIASSTKHNLPFARLQSGLHLPPRNLGHHVHTLQPHRNPSTSSRKSSPAKHMMEEMGAAYMAEGIVTLAGSRMYTSMADTDEVIDDALTRFERVLQKKRSERGTGVPLRPTGICLPPFFRGPTTPHNP